MRAEIQVRFVRDKSATPPALDAGFFLKTQHQKAKDPRAVKRSKGHLVIASTNSVRVP